MLLVDAEAAIRAEALALLEAASGQRAVSAARARAFARACIERDALGRAALAVLDGGAFAGTRLVELAEGVVRPSDELGDGTRNNAVADTDVVPRRRRKGGAE